MRVCYRQWNEINRRKVTMVVVDRSARPSAQIPAQTGDVIPSDKSRRDYSGGYLNLDEKTTGGVQQAACGKRNIPDRLGFHPEPWAARDQAIIRIFFI